jgi:predicted flap endonuclease-1-like 5' DNA nuclease
MSTMGLLDRILSLFGGGSDDSTNRSERPPDSRTTGGTPATEAEASVKGTDDSPEYESNGSDGSSDPVAAGTDAAASTASVTEPTEDPDPDTAAEPAEAAGDVTEHAGTEVPAAEPAEAAGPTPDEPAVETDETDNDEASVADEETGAPAEPIAAEPADDGVALESISGIGPAYASRLNEAGVTSVAELLEADTASLAEETGISEKRIGRWQDRAEEA